MFGNYQPSNFDLRFGVFGIPVRVTPMFWLGTAILGWESMRFGPPYLMMWALVCFISILVHELGHAIVARWMGCQVVECALYLMGGVALYIPGSRHTQGKSILIALAGPGAGFILWAMMNYVIMAPLLTFTFNRLDPNLAPLMIFGVMQWLYVNLWWGLVNLLPVLPLDGGRVCQGVCESLNRYGGERAARKISVGVAGLVALYFFTRPDGAFYPAILFLSLAINNWQSLQRD